MIITSSYITLCPISRIEYILLHLFLQLLPALLLGICNLSNLARGIRYNVCMLEISVHVKILNPGPMLKTFHEIAIKSYIFFSTKNCQPISAPYKKHPYWLEQAGLSKIPHIKFGTRTDTETWYWFQFQISKPGFGIRLPQPFYPTPSHTQTLAVSSTTAETIFAIGLTCLFTRQVNS